MSTNALRVWGKRVWKVAGDIQIQQMLNTLYLFTFPSEVEATRVLREGIRRWESGGILLDKRHPVAGCYRRREEKKDRCVCLFGLPIHLWGRATFEKIGALCGGLEEVVHQYPKSCEWVVLKVRRLEAAPTAVWFPMVCWDIGWCYGEQSCQGCSRWERRKVGLLMPISTHRILAGGTFLTTQILNQWSFVRRLFDKEGRRV